MLSGQTYQASSLGKGKYLEMSVSSCRAYWAQQRIIYWTFFFVTIFLDYGYDEWIGEQSLSAEAILQLVHLLLMSVLIPGSFDIWYRGTQMPYYGVQTSFRGVMPNLDAFNSTKRAGILNLRPHFILPSADLLSLERDWDYKGFLTSGAFCEGVSGNGRVNLADEAWTTGSRWRFVSGTLSMTRWVR